MASHDTEIRKLRALAQDNSVSIQKLHEEIRRLKNRLENRPEQSEPAAQFPQIQILKRPKREFFVFAVHFAIRGMIRFS